MRHLPVGKKLLLLLLLPFAVMLYFAGAGIAEQARTANELHALEALTRLAKKTGDAIHQLQKERGLSAGFLGSRGEKFAAELSTQRQRTDQAVAELQTVLRAPGAASDGDGLRGIIAAASGQLAKLGALRDGVSALSPGTHESFARYSEIVDALLDLTAGVTMVTHDAGIARATLAFVDFLRGKEQAGRERATLNAVFAADRFDAASMQRFLAILAKEQTYLDLFAGYATNMSVALYERKMASDATVRVEAMRKAALERMLQGALGVDSGSWFAAMTARIDAMKEVEDGLTAELDGLAKAKAARAERQLWLTAAVAVAAVAIALLISYGVSRRITAPVRELQGTMHRIHESHDLTLQCPVHGRDEIGQMAGAFNAMIARFRDTVAGVHCDAEQLAAAASRVAVAAKQVGAASASQSDAVAGSAAALEEMNAATAMVMDSAQRVADVSQESLSRANDGNVSISELFGTIDVSERTVRGIAESVREFIEDANRISQLTQEVRTIADQTNLLALNAAIEAARAGEHGRGFAVVADEVRKLAEKSALSAGEIDVLTQAVGKHSEVVAATVDSGVKSLEASDGSMEHVATVLADAAGSVKETAGGADEIAGAVAEQNVAMEDIARRVEAMAHMAEENSQAAASVSESTQTLNQLAARLKGAAGRFRY